MTASTPSPEPTTLARDEAGDFILPADLIAQRFGWPIETLHDMMRRGHVASRVERGEGDDAGHWRISVRCGNRRWQMVVDEGGRPGSERFEVLSSAP